MNKDLVAIFEYLEREKGIKREIVVQAIEDSLHLAAKKSVKSYGKNITVQIDPKTGDIEVFAQKEIVDKVDFPDEEISLADAQELAPGCEVGQVLEIVVTPKDFGRIAAQTARQVIAQKLRGAERDVIYNEYRDRMGELISGTIKRFVKGRNIIVDLGKVEAILPDRYYPVTEHYNVGERIQALLYEVRDTDAGGAEVVLSRSHPDFVVALFKQEVPELNDGVIDIVKIARDAGYRTKMLVRSEDPKIDPVGTCVGVRGGRIKNIIRELSNEKIDVVPYSENPLAMLQRILAPIEPKKVKIDDTISLVVADDDYPTVIGKRGMNARLISTLMGKELNVHKLSEYTKLISLQLAELVEEDIPELDAPLKIPGVSNLMLTSLVGAGYTTLRQVLLGSPQEMVAAVPGLNYFDLADKILTQYSK